MWVIFLLSSMSVAVVLLVLAYIANKVFIAMENDREKNKIKNNQQYEKEKEI